MINVAGKVSGDISHDRFDLPSGRVKVEFASSAREFTFHKIHFSEHEFRDPIKKKPFLRSVKPEKLPSSIGFAAKLNDVYIINVRFCNFERLFGEIIVN